MKRMPLKFLFSTSIPKPHAYISLPLKVVYIVNLVSAKAVLMLNLQILT